MITDGISPEAVTVYEEPETEGEFLNGDAVFLRKHKRGRAARNSRAVNRGDRPACAGEI